MRFEEASKAREQKKKLDELKKELAWAHVRGKEEDMTKKFGEVAKMSRRLPKIQANIDEASVSTSNLVESCAYQPFFESRLGSMLQRRMSRDVKLN